MESSDDDDDDSLSNNEPSRESRNLDITMNSELSETPPGDQIYSPAAEAYVYIIFDEKLGIVDDKISRQGIVWVGQTTKPPYNRFLGHLKTRQHFASCQMFVVRHFEGPDAEENSLLYERVLLNWRKRMPHLETTVSGNTRFFHDNQLQDRIIQQSNREEIQRKVKRALSRCLDKRVPVERQHAKDVICNICGNCFCSVQDLGRHTADVHNSVETFPCTEPGCGNIYLSKNGLKTHKTVKHLKVPPVICPHPDCVDKTGNRITFSTPRELKRHLSGRTHAVSNDGETFCPVANCDTNYSSTSGSNVRRHLQQRHKMTESQASKAMEVAAKKPLQTQRKNHRGEKKGSHAQCPDCNYYSHRCSVKRHYMKMHNKSEKEANEAFGIMPRTQPVN